MLLHAIALFALLSFSCLPSLAATGEWEKIDEVDGIKVFKKEIQGSRVFAFRGEALVKAPILKVASVVVDAKRAGEWVEALGESRIVRMLAKNEAVLYTHIKTPFVMKDRDFVCRVRLDVNAKEKTIELVYAPYVDPDAPETKYIRGEVTNSSFKMVSVRNGTETLVTTEIQTDPKGSIAKWIVNLVQKNWPRKTLQSLRAQAAKSDIEDNADIKAAVETMN